MYPRNLMLQAIIQMHNVGHMGITRLYLQLRQQFYSPKLRQMVKDIVHTCQECQPVKPLHPSHQKPIKMARLPEPYSTYSMDLHGPLTDKTDNSGSPFSYILFVKELWSGWVSLIPLCQTMTEAIAQVIYSDIILSFGNFKNLCSDNAANLTTLAVKEICHLLSIKTHKFYAYKAASNGKIERTMAVIGAAFRKFGQDTKEWVHLLKIIASSINSSPQAHTQFSPFFLQHFREYPSIFAFSDSTEDPSNDAHYYSNVVKCVMEDNRLSIDIYQQIHDDYCKTQED